MSYRSMNTLTVSQRFANANMATTSLRFGTVMNYASGPLEWLQAVLGALPADGSTITHDGGQSTTYLFNYEGPRYIAQIAAPFDMRLVGMSYAMDLPTASASMTDFTIACMKTSFSDMNDRSGDATWTTIGRISSFMSAPHGGRVQRGGKALYSTDGHGKVSAGDGVGWVLQCSDAGGNAVWGIITSIFEAQG